MSELQNTFAGENGVKVTVKPERQNGLWFSILINLVPPIIIGIFGMMMMNKRGGGARGNELGRNKAKALGTKQYKSTFLRRRRCRRKNKNW